MSNKFRHLSTLWYAKGVAMGATLFFNLGGLWSQAFDEEEELMVTRFVIGAST